LKIAIIGGGISGLTTAFYLKRYSPTYDITVFESESYFGGKLKTVDKYGFAIEISANGIFENNPESMGLIKDAGLENLLQYCSADADKKYIFDKGTLHSFPENSSAFFQTNLLGFFGKARAFMDIVIPKKKSDTEESFQKFGYRRIGKSATNILFDVLATIKFASNTEKLSANAAFGDFVALEKESGSFLGEMLKRANINSSLVGFKGGISSFTESLSRAFSFTKKLNTEVAGVRRLGLKWVVETSDGNNLEFDKVIIATPSFVTSRIIKDENEELGELLKNIEYSPIAVVALGYTTLPHPMDGFGIVTTKRSNTQILGIVWDSSIFPNSAADNNKLLRVIIGGQRQPLLALKEEEELLNIATGGVSETMGVYEEPLLKHVVRWHKAIPNYAVGHIALVDKIFEKADKMNGLYLNSSAYKGISLNDCIKNSRELALKIISE
jgi:protoporphyrinogen/coproporphyrinogen III oxidase